MHTLYALIHDPMDAWPDGNYEIYILNSPAFESFEGGWPDFGSGRECKTYKNCRQRFVDNKDRAVYFPDEGEVKKAKKHLEEHYDPFQFSLGKGDFNLKILKGEFKIIPRSPTQTSQEILLFGGRPELLISDDPDDFICNYWVLKNESSPAMSTYYAGINYLKGNPRVSYRCLDTAFSYPNKTFADIAKEEINEVCGCGDQFSIKEVSCMVNFPHQTLKKRMMKLLSGKIKHKRTKYNRINVEPGSLVVVD